MRAHTSEPWTRGLHRRRRAHARHCRSAGLPCSAGEELLIPRASFAPCLASETCCGALDATCRRLVDKRGTLDRWCGGWRTGRGDTDVLEVFKRSVWKMDRGQMRSLDEGWDSRLVNVTPGAVGWDVQPRQNDPHTNPPPRICYSTSSHATSFGSSTTAISPQRILMRDSGEIQVLPGSVLRSFAGLERR